MVCVIGAVILEMTEITVEVQCHLVLKLCEDFELNVYLGIYIYIQGVTGGTDQTSGECSLGQTILI